MRDSTRPERKARCWASGVVSGLASAFASGAEETAAETRRILLNCLEATLKDGKLWQVVE